MKTVVTLPYGYGRAYSGIDRFEKAAPTFNVDIYDDTGNRITDPYPSKVEMGPDMYRFLKRTVPELSARHGENNIFEGKVENIPHKVKELYAYYGFGNNPLSMYNLQENKGVGLIGFGNTETPTQSFGKDASGHDNFLYARKLDAPSPRGSNSRSAILTNILNDSMDFNPLFAPLYNYKDPEYVASNDPEGKGPRPTDHWVPRIDPNTGAFMLNSEGKPVWMPIPLTQDLPIYNFSHPMWDTDPAKAWELIHDPSSALNWKSWGKAPTFADYTGKTSTTAKGAIRPRDYYLANLKIAGRPGYFEDLNKEDLHQALRQYISDEKIANRNATIEEDVADYQKEQQELKEKKLARSLITNATGEQHQLIGRKGGMSGVRDVYNGLLRHMYKDPSFETKLNQMGIDKEDKKDILDFIMQHPEKYNSVQDYGARTLLILDDFAKNGRK